MLFDPRQKKIKGLHSSETGKAWRIRNAKQLSELSSPVQPMNIKQPVVAKERDFFRSGGWLRTRYKILVKYGARCQCCGASSKTGAVIHVDHIKPRSKHPNLELDPDNLQVLCDACNLGKSDISTEDWR